MGRTGSRRSEHAKAERPRPELTQPLPAPAPAAADAAAPEAAPEAPGMAARYWVAMLIWAAGFTLMVVFELIAAILRA